MAAVKIGPFKDKEFTMSSRRTIAIPMVKPAVPAAPWIAALLAALLIAASMLFSAPVRAAPAANPAEAFVQENIEKGYKILNDTGMSDEKRRAQFREFMLSLTDSRRIGMFTLGPYANSAPKQDVDAFIAAFSEFAVAIYETRLSKYKGQTLKVTGSQQRAADDIVVNTDVINPAASGGQPIKAAFRVRKAADGHPIVTDIEIEGVWLALSQRSDFTGFLQQHGGRVSDLTTDLQRQTQLLRSGGKPAENKSSGRILRA